MEIEVVESEEYELPNYNDPGRILVEIIAVSGERRPLYRYELEVLDYDADSSVFWVNEGGGFEYWFDENIDLELPGFYVIEGVTGTYIRGEWGYTDDYEEWSFARCRRATDEEIAARCLTEEEENSR